MVGMGTEPAGTDVRPRLEALRRDAQQRAMALRAERARVLAASEGSNADDEHDPEGATIAFEREQLTALLAAAERAEADADLALRRLDEGLWGRCESCGGPVAPQRLEARPLARTCIGCATRH